MKKISQNLARIKPSYKTLSTLQKKADTVIGDNFKEKTINICKYKDDYNLTEQIQNQQTQEPTGNINSSISTHTFKGNVETLASNFDTLANEIQMEIYAIR